MSTRDELRKQADLLNEEAALNWDNPKWRKEMEKAITETIYDGFESENFLSSVIDVENVPFDGRSYIKEVRGLMAHVVARGGYIETSSIRSDIFELPRDVIGLHVLEFEDKLMTGFAETQATLIDLGIQRLDAEVNRRFVRSLQAAVPSGADNYTSGAGLSLNALNQAIREVKDASLTGTVSIIGRATMTDQIIDAITTNGTFAGFLPETNEELMARGVLGSYRGARIITLKNYRDADNDSFFPANELFVAASDAGKFAFFGGLLSKEHSEPDNWYWHFVARRDFGGVIHHPERTHRIVDTSQVP